MLAILNGKGKPSVLESRSQTRFGMLAQALWRKRSCLPWLVQAIFCPEDIDAITTSATDTPKRPEAAP